MENYLVTYGFNKDREEIEHLKWISDLCSLHSLQLKKIIGNVTAKYFLIASNSKYVVCFIKFFAGKGGLYEFIRYCNMRAN